MTSNVHLSVVSKLGEQTIASEFDSHRVHHNFGLAPKYLANLSITRCNTRSIFEWWIYIQSFFFSSTGCLSKHYRAQSALQFRHSWGRGKQSEMQTAWSRIWTLVVNFIPYDHHHIALVARISLTLSRHSSLSFIALGRSSGQHPVSSHSCWMYVRAGCPAFARPCYNKHTPRPCAKVKQYFIIILDIRSKEIRIIIY